MRDLPDDLDLLRALDVLLTERHVTRAARRLGITQSALSQQLARLREYFSDDLLVAARPTMALTHRAEALAGPLSAALAELRAALQAGAPFSATEADRQFILLGNELLEGWGLRHFVPVLAVEAPLVRIGVERAEINFAERLEAGTADLAFMPEILVRSSLRRTRLWTEEFVVLMRRGHPAARGRLTLERYLAFPHVLVAPRGTPGSLVDDALARLGARRRVAVRVQHFMSAPFVLTDSDLLLTCPKMVVAFASEWLPLAVKQPPVVLERDSVAMVWHERMQRDPGHAWLRGRLQQLVAELVRSAPAKRR
jgi:DNA-binding transcriptional LysR family regulator